MVNASRLAQIAAGLTATALIAAACGSDGSGTSDLPVPVESGSAPAEPPMTGETGGDEPPPAPAVEPFAATPGIERAPVADDAPTDALAAGLNDAGFGLLRLQPVDENVVFSPSSIGHALLMASAAADEPTRAAIVDTFGLPDGAHEAWNAIDREIAADQNDQVTVTIADRIWPRIGLEPDQGWIDLLAAQHGADVRPLDFAGDTGGSRDEINEWVSDRTEGLIPELLPDGFLSLQTVLVLTDTLYFEADWARPFGKYGEQIASFTRLDGSTTDVEFMVELELGDRRGDGDGFVGAEIPYVGDDFSMLVIVPDEGRFEEVRDRLDEDLLDRVDAGFTTGPYELRLPKWETTTAIDLAPWLSEIGAMPGSYPAISPAAFLGGAVHGADIAVDEVGTVAAAATAIDFAVSGPPEPELVVAADQPYLYLIRHRPTGLVLFAGQV
ncbi:MAG: serpin family protein, partial [Actinomycetota bacterium]